jgi:ATP-dependent DNA helicase RecG
MTATPIPRTAAMVIFGDLDLTTLDEMPPGRVAITTTWLPDPADEHLAWDRVRQEVVAGHRAFVVCPLVGDSARVEARSATEEWTRLAATELAGLRVGLLHGQMPPAAREEAMAEFRRGETQVLVATTVIEVGVDVPNATVMVVMDAERFGVSQLHQLRGRVGRGTVAGLCLLVSEAPPASPARERLEAVAATLDGFKLSRLDLEQRREGDVLGATQAGRQSSLRLLRLLADENLIGQAREEASAVVSADPPLAAHPALREAIEELFGVQAEYLDKT